MPNPKLSPPIELSFNLELDDQLAGSWEGYSQRRQPVLLMSSTSIPTRRQQVARSVGRFAAGFLLGLFHLALAEFVLYAAANAVGYVPPMSVIYHGFYASGTLVAGFIWFSLLAGPPIQKRLYEARCRKQWFINFPEIFVGPVPVLIHFLPDGLSYEMLGGRNPVPVGKSLRLIETANYLLLGVRSGVIPLSKKQLAPKIVDDVLRWSSEANVLFQAASRRTRYLPPIAAVSLGTVFLVLCIWASKHIKLIPPPSIYPTSITLTLPDATTIVAGQVINLERLSYKISDNQGTLYDQLGGYVNRPEIAGTFSISRSATPFLAQTAEAEFEQERTWHLTIGQIPATATMEPLSDSGAFIAWDQPNATDYPGRCGALRSNSGTIPVEEGRVLWRNRLYLQLCSASMSKAELREWMLAAIFPMNKVLALRTQSNP